jgi:hypothetical protein
MAITHNSLSARESDQDIANRFGIAQDKPAASDEELDLQRWLRKAIVDIAQNLNAGVADSREKSLALTHLEEALMWAGKAIFR